MSESVLGHGLDTKPEMTFTLDPIAPNVLPPDPTLRDAIPMLSRLVRDPEFLQSHVLPLLEEAGRAEDWYVAYRHDDLRPLLLAAGLRLAPWLCDQYPRPFLLGSVLLCCGIHPGRALRACRRWLPARICPLEEALRLEWRREDGISTVQPYDGGIHRVGNPTQEPAISVHLYGPRLGEIDGRDYDPSRDYVCDRTEDEVSGR